MKITMNSEMKINYRRRLLAMAGLFAGAAALAQPLLGAPATKMAPIILVHGNGDSDASWQTVIWRFESNGWPSARLHALAFPYPLARDDDFVAQPGRSSTADAVAYLAAEVDRVLARTGARQVILIGSSRGGNAIRNYLQGEGTRAAATVKVSHAILCGTPNHGVFALPGWHEGSEFSGTGAFLSGLNAPKNAAGDEVADSVKWMTVRSDSNDKYAQPSLPGRDGKRVPSNVTYASPELKGAYNVVIAGIDHRETAFGPAAFAEIYRFITGTAPRSTAIAAQRSIVLSGKISGLGLDVHEPASGDFVNNLPLAGARLAIYAVDAATASRIGRARYQARIGADGQWGPFRAQSGVRYEFEIAAPGYATSHIYRSPFARSSRVISMAAQRIAAADGSAGAIVTLTRVRGYLDAGRDRMQFDGKPVTGLPPSGAVLAESTLKLNEERARAISALFNGERLVGRTWRAADNHLTTLAITD
jgi:triacylglycerol lipase